MRAVDTNILVRLLVRDDAAQVKVAEHFVAKGAWVSILVLVEALWVLDAVYERSPSQLAKAIDLLLNHETLTLQDADVVTAALGHFRKRHGHAIRHSSTLLGGPTIGVVNIARQQSPRRRAASAFQQLIRRIVDVDGGRRHRRADGSGFQVIQWVVSVGLILGRIQRHGLLHRQQPIQGIEGVGMGQRRADEGAGLLASVSKDVVRIIVLADDARRERSIDHLREGVVGEVGIAAIHAVRK